MVAFPARTPGATGMMVSKTARYALHASLEMALAGDEAVTVASVASKYGLPRSALAKVFQQLVRAGLAQGTRGVGGGYRLSRAPSAISVLDVVACFEPPRGLRRCLVSDHPDGVCPVPGCGLRNLFDETDDLLRSTFSSVSLTTLMRKRG